MPRRPAASRATEESGPHSSDPVDPGQAADGVRGPGGRGGGELVYVGDLLEKWAQGPVGDNTAVTDAHADLDEAPRRLLKAVKHDR